MIDFDKVHKRYGELIVLNDLSLSIQQGELVVLIGPSGCGKSTMLRLINRMTDISEGSIRVAGQDIMQLDPVALRRSVGYVIQSIGLFPHMTIAENIAVVPSILGEPRDKRQARVKELMHLVGLEPSIYAQRYPKQLSGGQQQRVGIARALAANPAIMLMDEPFSAVDPITREQLQDSFLRLKQEIQKTIVFVTHDVDEAVKLADRICILQHGQVQQYDRPDVLLRQPANDFVASFVGEDRQLKRLSRLPVTNLMQSKTIPDAPIITADKSARDALIRLLETPVLNVVDEAGEAIGSLRLEDLRQ